MTGIGERHARPASEWDEDGTSPSGTPFSWPLLQAAASPAAVSPSGHGAVVSVANSGTTHVDALLAGERWGSGGAGSSVSVEYSFASWGAVWSVSYGFDEPLYGYAPLSTAQQQAARIALQRWDEVANIRFVEVAETALSVGEIRFAVSGIPPTAWAYTPGPFPEAGDVWIGTDPEFRHVEDGSYGLVTLIHEIGHAIGLKHPHEADGSGIVLPTELDYLGNTVMSYRSYIGDTSNYLSNSFFPTTPGPFDIAAIQYLYGVDTTTRTGDTVYRWDPAETIFETIWDAGGTDRIDWSNQASAAVIDLEPGAWSRLGPGYETDAGHAAETLAIAYGAVIENATGGTAQDNIAGNGVANLLAGGGGGDTLVGAGGDDTLLGQYGRDRLSGGWDDDLLRGGASNDTIVGGFGADTLDGGTGADSLDGGAGNDLYLVDDPGDVVVESPGHGTDAVLSTISWTLAPSIESLTLGGTAPTQGVGNGLDNEILGNAAANELRGGAGDDRLAGRAGDDSVFGGAGDDRLYGNLGDDDLAGGTGDDTLNGGDGGDRFVFAGIGGNDMIADFQHGSDRIRIVGYGAALNGFDDLAMSEAGMGVLIDLGAAVAGAGTILVLGFGTGASLEATDFLWT